jgi:Zn-dependent peptidase ImmA (M78 family)
MPSSWFASALLIPREDFDAAMPDKRLLKDFVAMKTTWGVSVAALVYRAHELEYIGDARYRALQIQMSKWRKNEPATFEPMRGHLFSKLVEVNGGTAAVAVSLGVNRRDLAELMNWSHLRIA